MLACFIFCLILILCNISESLKLLNNRKQCTNMKSEKIVNIIMQNYSRSIAPANPVAVQVEATIQDINELSVLSNFVSVDLWFSAIWHDPRLKFSHLDPCRRNLSFDETFEKHLWSPNVCLVNTKSTRVHASPKPNVLLMLLANGTVWLNYRVRVEAPCEFQISDFPMDSARCQLVFESYSFNTATVTIDWMSSPLTLLFDEISASDHQLIHTKLFKHTEYYKAGEWYRLTLELGFRRRYGYYLLQVYVNTYINVFLSWIAFCISLKALSARVILSVNTLISLCVQFGNIINSLPPVSYVKPIDVFMIKKMLRRSIRFSVGVGSLFDLACLNKTLAETASNFGGNIGAISGVRRKPSQQIEEGDDYDSNCGSSGRQSESLLDEISRNDSLPNMPKRIAKRILLKQQNKYLTRGYRVDQFSFFLFPLAFTLFNILYWAYYLGRRKN
ncbi:hypothetical protein Mgra_00007094 [Meloidogyne graminicola]|uniref:Neur_chan_LBD domain-containing protein n=1 Tax=Meloidogyne graminicola TaxID=189291 RepID=A0A8S9ZJB2_9BILA|nr:hypothetical protein Mgra_00007094 [Meloidogyne graminicola]